MTRVEIFAAFAAGDGTAAEMSALSREDLVVAMYRRDYLTLVRYLTFLGVPEAVAQEIGQDTFLKLYEHVRGEMDRNNLRGWLYRVARNAALNERAAAHTRASAQRRSEEKTEEIVTAPERDSPESIVMHKERLARIRQALERLPILQRECLVLRAQQMKYREIAAVLGVSISAVGQNVQAGVKKLRELE